jgi:endonuclease/exonuclease/phosphatase (EEP) superfamily protein YafD
VAFAGGEPITVVATHPFPPVRSAVAVERNRQLAAIADFTASETGEVVVVGDLNVSPWSPYFQDLLRDGKLRDSRRGFDLQPTWPTFCPPLMTPIDHVLTSGGLAVSGRRTGPNIGSDHRPIVAVIGRRDSR